MFRGRSDVARAVGQDSRSGDLGDPAEGRGVAHGEVGEDLAVEVDVGLSRPAMKRP